MHLVIKIILILNYLIRHLKNYTRWTRDKPEFDGSTPNRADLGYIIIHVHVIMLYYSIHYLIIQSLQDNWSMCIPKERYYTKSMMSFSCVTVTRTSKAARIRILRATLCSFRVGNYQYLKLRRLVGVLIICVYHRPRAPTADQRCK